jgi:hypothetical protein
MKATRRLGWLFLVIPALACSPPPDEPGPDAAPPPPPDARVQSPDTAPPPPPPPSPDAAPPVTPDAGVPSDASAPPTDAGPRGDSGPSAPVMEAMWPLTGCNQMMLMYPNIDKNMGRFPVGSCPPPDNLPRPCGGESRVPVKMATTSNFETGMWHPPQYAIDEYMITRWSTGSQDNHWLALDLGEAKSFKRMYLTWEAAFASGYDIQTSPDGMAWTGIKQVRGGNGFQDIVDVEATSRYIRILGVTRGNRAYGISLFDVTICGELP